MSFALSNAMKFHVTKPQNLQIPVKCPVSGIVKHRKVQGRECFEVLWEGLDGIETSIVPADLVERACPEKITEFEEKRALGKKQNHRQRRVRKSESRSAVAEVDLRLQNLMLDIESGSNAALKDSFASKTVISNNRTSAIAVPFTNQEPPIVESQNDTNRSAALSSCCAGPSLPENNIIDLLSPSPLPRASIVSRCKQASDQCIDVIDLSDSEAEMSCEHMKKARELRLFLASIRDDIS